MKLPPLPPKKRAVFHHPNGMALYDGLAMDMHAMAYAEPLLKEFEELTNELKQAYAQIEKLSEPDHFWDADNPEHSAETCTDDMAQNIADRMVSYSDEPERVEVRVLCAKALPDRVMIVAVSNDGSVGWHWDDDQNKAPIA